MAQTQHALFHKGLQESISHTPGSAVPAGDFVFFGSGLEPLVAVSTYLMPANILGDLQIAGQYKVKALSTAVFAVGDLVGWDEAAEEAVVASSGDLTQQLGVCTEAKASGDDFVVAKINTSRGWEASA